MAKQSMVVVVTLEDVKLERVRVTFPNGLSVPQALRAGMLVGGAEFVESSQLRQLAEDQLRELGVEAKCLSKRGVLHTGPRIASTRPLKSILMATR